MEGNKKLFYLKCFIAVCFDNENCVNGSCNYGDAQNEQVCILITFVGKHVLWGRRGV